MTDLPSEKKEKRPSPAEKWRWWVYYHTRTLKGRFEVYHFLEWLCFMAVCIALVEAVLLWLGV